MNFLSFFIKGSFVYLLRYPLILDIPQDVKRLKEDWLASNAALLLSNLVPRAFPSVFILSSFFIYETFICFMAFGPFTSLFSSRGPRRKVSGSGDEVDFSQGRFLRSRQQRDPDRERYYFLSVSIVFVKEKREKNIKP